MSEFLLVTEKLLSPFSLLVLYLVILLLAKWAANRLVSYNLNQEIAQAHNNAIGLSLAGYLIAVTIVFCSALIGPSQGLINDVLLVGGYSTLGIVLLNVASVINDKIILYQFCNKTELVDQQNLGTGAVMAGSFIASGLIVAGSVHGQGGGVHTVLVFFVLGQFALVLIAKIYNLVTPYDVHDEIEQNNMAAGIAFAGTLTALGLILMNAAAGNFISWGYNLGHFAVMSTGAIILLPLFRYVMDKLLMRHYDLNHEIHHDKNSSAGILEFTLVTSFATVVFFVL